ncbi:anti-anti-sigma factor [Desulfobaculum xiamenense]|uniref:Anti-anti-sigma factor n=1 Tax=Desulfobaculum xiamenense TaxID=995050 RepID=A0A846QV76_9BACT|nr:STAS domain-containing protein [Desulfobaculum xiamenense]NJB68549.1 anti-anti-sigma factor [Desulfobaculum xiamenense]
MRMTCLKLAGVCVLYLEGAFDVDAAGVVADEIARRVDGGRYRFILDLSGLDEVNEEAIGTLARARRALRERGADIWLAAPSDEFCDVLGDARLGCSFDMYGDVRAAADAYR